MRAHCIEVLAENFGRLPDANEIRPEHRQKVHDREVYTALKYHKRGHAGGRNDTEQIWYREDQEACHDERLHAIGIDTKREVLRISEGLQSILSRHHLQTATQRALHGTGRGGLLVSSPSQAGLAGKVFTQFLINTTLSSS